MNVAFMLSGMMWIWKYTMDRHCVNVGYKGYERSLRAHFAVYSHIPQKNVYPSPPTLMGSAVELSCERPIPLVESVYRAVELSCERPIPLVESSS